MSDQQRFLLDDDEVAFTFGKALKEVEEKDWDESKHPRDPGGEHGGEFTSGGGGGESDDSDIYSKEEPDKFGLNSVERVKMREWLGSGYRDLRTDKSFGKTLEKFPEVKGKVFRGTRVSEDGLARLKPGAIYPIDKFSSTTQKRDIAYDFMDAQRHKSEKKIPVLFEIQDRGRKIPRALASEEGVEDEAEVVLMIGDKYKIEKVEKDVDGADKPFTRVSMSEANG